MRAWCLVCSPVPEEPNTASPSPERPVVMALTSVSHSWTDDTSVEKKGRAGAAGDRLETEQGAGGRSQPAPPNGNQLDSALADSAIRALLGIPGGSQNPTSPLDQKRLGCSFLNNLCEDLYKRKCLISLSCRPLYWDQACRIKASNGAIIR